MNHDKPKEPPIQFKPITSGLGFHPFSEGLPYAPSDEAPLLPTRALPKRPDGLNDPSNDRAKMAAPLIPEKLPQVARAAHAAASAGKLSTTPVLPPRPPNKTASSGASQAGTPFFSKSIPVLTPPRPAVPTQPALNWMRPPSSMTLPAQSKSALVFEERKYGMSYVIKRIVAYAFDTALNFSLGVAAMAAVLWKLGVSVSLLKNPSLINVSLLFLAAFSWSLIAAQEIVFGTTAGKRLFNLVLSGSTSAIFLRSLIFLPSLAIGGLGIFWAVVDPKRRCWHDLALGLQPDEIAQL